MTHLPLPFLVTAGHQALTHRFPIATPLALSTLGLHGCSHTGQLQDACLGCFSFPHACRPLFYQDVIRPLHAAPATELLSACQAAVGLSCVPKEKQLPPPPRINLHCKSANWPALSPSRMPLTPVCRSTHMPFVTSG